MRAYAIALAALVAAVLLRVLLDPLLGDALPLVTLFGAVAAAAWAGGHRPAILVALLGYIACNYLFVAPRHAIGPIDAPAVAGFATYALTCALIIGIGAATRLTQQRTSQQAELLRVTLGSIGDAVVTTDLNCRVVSLNAVAESLTGWTNAEARGRGLDEIFRIINEKTREPLENPAVHALRKNAAVGLADQAVLIARNGVELFIDDSAAPIKDRDGRVSGCVLIFRDISQRRRWESVAAGRQAEARLLAAIVASSDDAIVSKSLDGIIQSWNESAERLFGFTAEQAVGRHVSLIIPPDRIAEEEKIIASLKAGERVDHFETERRRSDGRRLQVSLTISPINDDAGNVVGASKIARDISERKEAEAERDRLVTLVENSTDFIGVFDLEGVPLYVNPAGLALVGLDDMEAARRTHLRDFCFPEDQARLMDEFLPSVIRTGHGEIDVRFRNFRTQEARWMAHKFLNLTEAGGRNMGFATVSQDVTERKRLDDNLRKLAEDLSEVDRRKNEFLATLSHELRNPLAPLRNMLEVLKRGNRETVGQAVETMERQVGQLVRLVDDLLDISRITHNRIELRKTRVELAASIEQAVEASRSLAEESGHKIEVVVPRESIYVNADPVRLTQVVDNLLNNSCKYTPPGGRISVTAKREGNEAVITVADSGIGIPPENLSTIFDMFTQIDGSIERSRGGLGIGLTLVKRLVEMHAGSIEAKSAGEGKGSEFIVRLPVMVEAAKAAPAAKLEHEPAKTYRILVVDDNQDAATSLSTLLQMTGHETFTAFDGPTALEAMERHRPEVVLLDIGLPAINGYEVCRRARAQPWGGDATFIALTGWGQEEDRRRTQEAGFDSHLVKPVEFGALIAQLNALGAMRKA